MLRRAAFLLQLPADCFSESQQAIPLFDFDEQQLPLFGAGAAGSVEADVGTAVCFSGVVD